MPRVTSIEPDGTWTLVDVAAGESLLSAAVSHGATSVLLDGLVVRVADPQV